MSASIRRALFRVLVIGSAVLVAAIGTGAGSLDSLTREFVELAGGSG
jgi:hypothetical protein